MGTCAGGEQKSGAIDGRIGAEYDLHRVGRCCHHLALVIPATEHAQRRISITCVQTNKQTIEFIQLTEQFGLIRDRQSLTSVEESNAVISAGSCFDIERVQRQNDPVVLLRHQRPDAEEIRVVTIGIPWTRHGRRTSHSDVIITTTT